MAERIWKVRLAARARADFKHVLRWTAEQFGETQMHHYRDALNATIHALSHGPDVRGARGRDDIAPDCKTLHIARQGSRGRHLMLFRVRRSHGEEFIEVLRILHDAMDIALHFPPEER